MQTFITGRRLVRVFDGVYRRSLEEPEAFWADAAALIDWDEPWEHVLHDSRWFVGGRMNLSYNCLDCHGADGSGAMGPSFQDGRWHFGGSPAEVFESIYQGRPDGMPAWGGRISNDQIWMLTAYVRSLASKDLSTENFTGKTVERTGH